MALEPINHFALSSHPSIYDEEAMTALELAGRTAAKTNECVEAFNEFESRTNSAVAGAVDFSTNSEAWAAGTKNGVDVNSADDQYHNNAKYYAGKALDSQVYAADNANVSLGYSRDSEAWAAGTKNGVDVNSADDQYHNNAKYYAGKALDSQVYAADNANVSLGYSRDSEAWAAGTKNGVDVTAGADQYQNNAKYYAEQANETKAETSDIVLGYARDSEAWAAGTKNGVDVTAEADQYENNAKYYAEQANDSKEYTANIANIGLGYARDSEAWAAGTTDGLNIPTNADQYQNNAKYYAEQAALYGDKPVISVLKYNALTPHTADNTAVLTSLFSNDYNRQYVRLHVYDWNTEHTAMEVKYILTPYGYKKTDTSLFYYFYNTSTLTRYTIQLVNSTYSQEAIATNTFITPTLLSSWVADTGYNVGFLKDSSGVVHIKGRIKSGIAGNPAFMLPSGFLPSATNAYFPVVSNGTLSYVTISSSGIVMIPATANNTYVTLDGISFIAEL